MTTTTFEFGYLFGGVENISFNDKIAAITQAHKQGYSYVVERRETFDEGEREVELRLIGWGLSLIHISEPTRRTPISYAVFCLKKKKKGEG